VSYLAGPLLIIGRGGFGTETVEVVRSINERGGAIEIVGFADDDQSTHGTERLGVPVLGGIEETVQRVREAALVVTTGSPSSFDSRRRIVERLGEEDTRYATLVHPTAVVPQSARLGVGCVVHANVIMTADIVVGRHVVVMPGAVLTHGDRVGDYVTIASGAMLAGDVAIGSGAYVGAGALIRERISIGERSLIGMGAIVLTEVPPGEVWVGAPASPIRS
jgi:sugar O-acyltransferase (sialic acid O-acetyltransferase NeuD family)